MRRKEVENSCGMLVAVKMVSKLTVRALCWLPLQFLCIVPSVAPVLTVSRLPELLIANEEI